MSKKTKDGIIIYAVIIVGFLLTLVFAKYANKFYSENTKAKIETAYDEVDREFALTELWEMHGRVKQIQQLSRNATFTSKETQDELKKALYDIAEELPKDEPYLQGFSITITTSRTDDICEEIKSQIYQKILTVMDGKKEGA